MTDWLIRVPASSANVGAGFDVLGMALTLHAEVGCGTVPDGTVGADAHHPAAVAFRRLGGTGGLWVRSPIPMGRGLGYSGAVRVGGALAAVVQRNGRDAIDDPAARAEVLDIATELEQHADNAAASLAGGVVIAAAGTVTRVPLAFDPAVVVWIPDSTTSTDQSRTGLPETIDRRDAVFNLGRVAMFVAACASGDATALRAATDDRLHQAHRLEHVPTSAAAISTGLEAGAWAAWLSGSGPTVAMLCESRHAPDVAAALPDAGHVKQLRIDHEGARVTDVEPSPAESAVTPGDGADASSSS